MTRPLPHISDRAEISRGIVRTRDLELRGPGPWQYVGDPAFCDFVNGANAAPSAEIPDPMPLRIRWTLGAGLEIQGDVTGLAPGDIVCVFPHDYRLDHDVPVPGHDDNANYVGCRLYKTGEFVYGVA